MDDGGDDPSNDIDVDLDLGTDDGGDDPTDDIDVENYFNLLQAFSKRWLSIQLTHNVSLKATDAFWKLAVNSLRKIYRARKLEKIKKNIPQFTHVRRTLYAKDCPRVGMNFAYRHKQSEHVHLVSDMDKAPIQKFENDPDYQKLYEVAFVKVRIYV